MEDFEIVVPQPGERYRHYKGGEYEVIAVGRLSEQRDQIVVVYRSLERGHTWVRPLGMWSEYVEWTEYVNPTFTITPTPHTYRAQRFVRVAAQGHG